jgi:hypothetical protein
LSMYPLNVAAQVALHAPQSEEWIIAGTVPGSATAGTITAATIQRQATSAAQTQQTCPVRETWEIERFYFVGTTPTPDTQVVILVDLVPQPYQPLASSLNLTQNRPAALSNAILVQSGSNVTAQIVNFVANASTLGVLVIFKAQVKRVAP